MYLDSVAYISVGYSAVDVSHVQVCVSPSQNTGSSLPKLPCIALCFPVSQRLTSDKNWSVLHSCCFVFLSSKLPYKLHINYLRLVYF